MAIAADLIRGHTDTIILAQLTHGDSYGYNINRVIQQITGGQYELKRRREAENNRSQSGLELDVIDHYNGSERSVKTLSGVSRTG